MAAINKTKFDLIIAGLITTIGLTVSGCGVLQTQQILKTIDSNAKYQASQSPPGVNIKDLNYIYTAFETYTNCLERLTKTNKINSQQKSELLKAASQKFREYDLPDVRQVKVYSAVTSKFCR